MSDTSIDALIQQAVVRLLEDESLTASDLALLVELNEAGYLNGDES